MTGVDTHRERSTSTSHSTRAPRARWLLLVLALPGMWQAATLISIVAARAGFPMDLEWMEGGQLYHAQRLIDGQQIYPALGDGFLPYPYPPVHYLVLAGAGRVLGLDYAMARIISALFIAGAAVLLARAVARAWTAAPRPLAAVAGAVAIGLIAVTYPEVDGWFDLVRNDSMAIALTVAAAAVCSRPRLTRRAAVGAAVVLVFAVLTKQTMGFLAAWLALWVVIFHRRMAIAFTCTLAVGALASLAALQLASGGWFWHYAVASLAGDEVTLDGARFGLETIAAATPYVAVALALAIVGLARDLLSARAVLWVGLLVAAFPAALLPMAKAGGAVNGVLPVAVLAGPVTLILAGEILAGPARESARPVTPRTWWMPIGALAAGAAFVLVNPIDRGTFVPDGEAWDRAERLNDYVAGLDGGVMAPSQPFLPVRNGHTTPQVHMMGYVDAGDMHGRDLRSALAWMASAPAGERSPGAVPGWHLAALVERERPRWILLGSPIDHLAPRLGWIPPGYVPAGRVPDEAEAPDGLIWPDEIYERAERVP